MNKLFLLSFLLISSLFSKPYTLSVVAIFQNEAPYLKEWIDYHLEKGVEHFWLYNNNSTDNYYEVLKPYIKKKIVKLIEWPSVQNENDWLNFSFTIQPGAYNDALKRARHTSKWLAIIDTDEFIVPVTYKTIPELLEAEYSHVSGLCVNWQCYGTSQVEKAAQGGLLNNLVWKMRWNHHHNNYSKSIVQPLHVESCPNPHYCIYKPTHWAVDVNFNWIEICCTSVNIDKIRINHYWTRDEWFLQNVKIARYLKWGLNVDAILEQASLMNEEYDPILQKR